MTDAYIPQLVLDKDGKYNPQELNRALRYLGEAVNALSGRTGAVTVFDDVTIDGDLRVNGNIGVNTDPETALQIKVEEDSPTTIEAFGTEGPALIFRRAGGSADTPLGVVEGMELGKVAFSGWDGAGLWQDAASLTIDAADGSVPGKVSGNMDFKMVRKHALEPNTLQSFLSFDSDNDRLTQSGGGQVGEPVFRLAQTAIGNSPSTLGTVEFFGEGEVVHNPGNVGSFIRSEIEGVLGSKVAASLHIGVSTDSLDATDRLSLETTGAIRANKTDNGAYWEKGSNSELLTLTGVNTDTSSNLLPANSIIDAVVARVIQTAHMDAGDPTAFRLGDPTTATRFG